MWGRYFIEGGRGVPICDIISLEGGEEGYGGYLDWIYGQIYADCLEYINYAGYQFECIDQKAKIKNSSLFIEM